MEKGSQRHSQYILYSTDRDHTVLEISKDTDEGPWWGNPWEVHCPSEGTKSDNS